MYYILYFLQRVLLKVLYLHLICFVLYFALPFTALYFIKAVTRSLILYSCLYLMMTMTNALIVWNMQSTWMCTSDTRPLQNLLRFISLDGTLNCITFTGTHLKSAQYTKSTYIGKIELPPPKKKKKKKWQSGNILSIGRLSLSWDILFWSLMEYGCNMSAQYTTEKLYHSTPQELICVHLDHLL